MSASAPLDARERILPAALDSFAARGERATAVRAGTGGRLVVGRVWLAPVLAPALSEPLFSGPDIERRLRASR